MSFSLGTACVTDIWGTAFLSASKAWLISLMRLLSLALAVFRLYLLRGAGFCLGFEHLDLGATRAMLSRFSSGFLRRSDRGRSEYLSPAEDLSESLLLLGSVYAGLSGGMDSRWDSSSSYSSMAQVAGGFGARSCFGGGRRRTAVLSGRCLEIGRLSLPL